MRVVVPAFWSDVLERHKDWIAGEVLATDLGPGDVAEPSLEKA